MICKVCLKNNAQFHLPHIINNELVEIHLCRECVQKHRFPDSPNDLDNKLDSLLEGLIQYNFIEKAAFSDLKCNFCGMTLKEFQKTGLLGCQNCYSIFDNYITKDKKRFESLYKKKSHNSGLSEQVLQLKRELKMALERENFEKAAEIRDIIKRYEKEGFFSDN